MGKDIMYTLPFTEDFLKTKGTRLKKMRYADKRFVIKTKNFLIVKGYSVALIDIDGRLYLYRNHDDNDIFRIPKKGNMMKATPNEFKEYFEKGNEQVILKEWKCSERNG